MLDVVLYGYDREGRLTLQERSFHSLRGLAYFFACSTEATPWEWAEVTTVSLEGKTKVTRYSSEDLRAIIERSSSGPTAN